MSFVFTNAKLLLAQGLLDFREAGLDLRVALLKTVGNTTCDTEKDKTTITGAGGFTTLGELVATNYVRKACATQAVAQDNPNLRAEFTFDPITWTALGGAANDTIGALLLFKFVTNDGDSIPIAYIDNAGSDFALATNGSDVTLTPDAQGVLQFT